jgi:pimeloyl-ACP methyl ester carboxylesterase
MERISVNGAEFEIVEAGTGEPLLLIHGSIIGDAYKPLLSESALTSRYRVIQYHRRGFCGSSRPPRPFTIPEQAQDALAILRRVCGESAHVAGHSYGGVIGIQLALDAPEAVHSLALFEPALFTGPQGRRSPRGSAQSSTFTRAATRKAPFQRSEAQRWRQVTGGNRQAAHFPRAGMNRPLRTPTPSSRSSSLRLPSGTSRRRWPRESSSRYSRCSEPFRDHCSLRATIS